MSIFENIGSGISSAFSYTMSSIGSMTGSGISHFAKGAIESLRLEEIGGQVAETLAKIFKESVTRMDTEHLSSNLRDSLGVFRKNFKEAVGDTISDMSDIFKEGVTKMDMAGNMRHLAGEFHEGIGVFRENFVSEIDHFRDDVQSILANMARDTTLEIVPWIALGGIFLTSAPLLTYYVYKKAAHNIGRPKLSQEVRKVALWDRATDGVSRATSNIWSSTKDGIKWSILTGVAGLTAITAGTASSLISGGNGEWFTAVPGFFCAMGVGPYYCDPTPGYPLIAAVLGAGILRSSSGIASKVYDFAKRWNKKETQPIFNDEIQTRIDEITRATYNTKRNEGYMQNLLLYGPGGTGKTMVSKYIAKNSNMNYIMMSGGDLPQYIKRGEHVTELNKLFESINSPTIVFIDECESLCGDRGKMNRSESIELVNAFLNHTGEPSKKVMVILTTNRPEDLDPAVLSRMDHQLYIGPPEESERKKIIELYLPTFMTPQERKELFTDEMIATITKQTDGFTGRTIFKMLNAISSKRASTTDNRLTEQMITDTVNAFIKQKTEIERRTQAAPSLIADSHEVDDPETEDHLTTSESPEPVTVDIPEIEDDSTAPKPATETLEVDNSPPVGEQKKSIFENERVQTKPRSSSAIQTLKKVTLYSLIAFSAGGTMTLLGFALLWAAIAGATTFVALPILGYAKSRFTKKNLE